jgi:excisionase family DNA binding protein
MKSMSRQKHIPPDLSKGKADSIQSHELLRTYLSLPKQQREERFADTAHVAQMTGLTQRTIQFWIEIGAIDAVPVGGKYQVSLESLEEYLEQRAEK